MDAGKELCIVLSELKCEQVTDDADIDKKFRLHASLIEHVLPSSSSYLDLPLVILQQLKML